MSAPTRRTTSLGADGFTVIELSIVMAIALVIMASLLAILTSQSNAAARVDRFVADQEEVRLVLDALQRDLRSADSLVELPADVDRSSRVDLEVYATADSVKTTLVRWRVLATHDLVREVVSGEVIQVTAALPGVSLPSTGLLTYFSAGAGLPLTSAETPGTIANCTMRVRIDLAAAPSASAKPVRLLSEVQLRNRVLGRSGC